MTADNLESLSEQELKPWPKNPRYLVSNNGRVFSKFSHHRSGIIQHNPPKELTRRIGTAGYWVVFPMFERGKQRCQFCHRMVLEAWVGECPRGLQCAHMDGTRTNCTLENLRWVSPAENMFHQRQHGTALLGERNHNAKLTDAQAIAVVAMRHAGFGPKQISGLFGITRQSVQQIVRGEKYGEARAACIALLRASRSARD